MSYDTQVELSVLLGKTITEIKGGEVGSDAITFILSDGEEYQMYHEQDCCEGVAVDDIVGDISDLLNSPITLSEEVSTESEAAPKKEYVDSYTWTFYRLATVKGYVTIKWLGESNGYYSESVYFVKL